MRLVIITRPDHEIHNLTADKVKYMAVWIGMGRNFNCRNLFLVCTPQIELKLVAGPAEQVRQVPDQYFRRILLVFIFE